MKTQKLLIALMAILFFSGQIFAQNLLNNPSFEAWTNGTSGPPDGWNVSNASVSAGQSTATVHDGTYSTLLTWTSTSTVRLQQLVDIDPNTSYELSFWALDTTAAGRLRITIRWYDSAGNTISGIYGSYTLDDPNWQQLVSGVQTSPNNADSANIEIRMYDVSSGWNGSASIFVDDVLFESAAGASPSITKAYALSSSEMDVVYDLNLPPVDPADYTLTGTNTITFSTATIDGSDPKLLHLSGASSPMTGDLSVDTITDAANNTSIEFYAGIMPVANLNTNNPAGHISDGKPATFQGIVSANDNYNNVWFSDASGARNGTLIYDNSFDGLVDVGDEILLIGTRFTYNGLTELKDPELLSTISTGNTPYGPDVIPASDIEENIAQDTDPAEAWEGQLVKIENFTVDSYTNYDYTCSAEVGGTTYIFHIGDNVDYHFNNISLVVGGTYNSITGVVDWKSGMYRINPREQADIAAGGTPMIVKSYSVNNNAVDILYNQDMTSINAADFSLTGTITLGFGTAIIDATDAKLVHLSNPTSPIQGDLIMDTIHDSNASYTFYAGIMPFANLNTTNPGGFLPNGNIATFKGIVYANNGTNKVWISDGNAEYNGVLIYDNSFDNLVNIGDEILFLAERDVYNNLTELKYPELLDVISTGNALYGPSLIAASDIDENIGADTDPAEKWEGQFVKIENFVVDSYTNYDYTCSTDIGGTTYIFHLGDAVDYHFGSISLNVGQTYDFVQGAIDFKSGKYRINPRNSGDVVGQEVTPTRLAITDVNGGVPPIVNSPFSISVEVQDDSGNLATVSSAINFSLTTNGGASGTVAFAAGSTTAGSFAAGENQITLTGIIMSPVGTDITITADDGTLTAGTSDLFDVIAAPSSDIVIVEIMQNPQAVGDGSGEWFELFNKTSSPIDLNAYIIKDEGSNVDTINTTLIIPAMGFVTLGKNADNTTNGDYTCDYQYSNFTLANGDDEIILLNPSGVEIDRVEYDGGAVWPDPNGKSMVFTGLASDDNNDGNLWIEADLRENTYVGATGDLGSPGTNGNHQQLTGSTPANQLLLSVFLEGAMNGSEMATNINGIIPNTQPYSGAPWNYSGSESFATVPNADVVDWVLVELRDATDAATANESTIIKTMAGLLLKDGSIVATDGSSNLTFTNSIANNLYVAVYHRNHLGIMSNVALSLSGTTYTYDFTNASDAAFGTDAQQHIGSVYAMYAGDVNGDGEIDDTDDTNLWISETGTSGYLPSDVNLDGQSNNIDKNDYWFNNEGIVTQIP
jgi:hypothetical protein